MGTEHQNNQANQKQELRQAVQEVPAEQRQDFVEAVKSFSKGHKREGNKRADG